MAENAQFFFRAYSKSSAGGLVSGIGRGNGRPLSDATLQNQFLAHQNRYSEKKTALVSVSSRMVDTLQRAFNKYYQNNEDPSTIWIAIIKVPASKSHLYHHAEDLARKWGSGRPSKHENIAVYRYEYLFEWGIPKRYVVLNRSVARLMTRGVDLRQFLNLSGRKLPYVGKFRELVRDALCEYSDDKLGVYVGFLARCFDGDGDLTFCIAMRIIEDCATSTPDGKHLVIPYDRWGKSEGFVFRRSRIEAGVQKASGWACTHRSYFKDYRECLKGKKKTDWHNGLNWGESEWESESDDGW